MTAPTDDQQPAQKPVPQVYRHPARRRTITVPLIVVGLAVVAMCALLLIASWVGGR